MSGRTSPAPLSTNAAEGSLARLELASEMVSSVGWVLYAFVRKEAVLSSQIEGTQATLMDLLSFEATERDRPEPDPETDLVSTSIRGLRLLELLPEHPVVTVGKVTQLLETTKPTASKAVNLLVDLGLLTEQTGRLRDRTFAYDAYAIRTLCLAGERAMFRKLTEASGSPVDRERMSGAPIVERVAIATGGRCS